VLHKTRVAVFELHDDLCDPNACLRLLCGNTAFLTSASSGGAGPTHSTASGDDSRLRSPDLRLAWRCHRR
jgi:hypothetical protein